MTRRLGTHPTLVLSGLSNEEVFIGATLRQALSDATWGQPSHTPPSAHEQAIAFLRDQGAIDWWAESVGADGDRWRHAGARTAECGRTGVAYMPGEEIESAARQDVYRQYKAMVDYHVLEIMDAAQALMAVVDELGCASYEITDGTYTVVIKRTERTEGGAHGGDPSNKP